MENSSLWHLGGAGVYELISPDNRRYIGRSGCMAIRLAEHCWGIKRGGETRSASGCPELAAEMARHTDPSEWIMLVRSTNPDDELELIRRERPELNKASAGA